MLELADTLGAARLATGHYARIARDAEGPLVRAAADPRKDQSYMLAKLDPALLDRLSFPLGGLTKDAVRALARDAGLPVADKRESQDLCFVAGLGGRAFLAAPRRAAPAPRRARSSTATARCSAITTASTTSPSASAAGSAWRVTSRSTCSSGTRATNRVVVGPAEALATTPRGLDDARLHRARPTVETVRLRYHSPRASLPASRRPPAAGSRSSSTSPPTRSRPASSPAS